MIDRWAHVNLHGLVNTVRRSRILAGINVGQEHGIDERRFAQARLTDDHQRELEALLDGASVHLVGEIGEADVVHLTRLGRRRHRRRRPGRPHRRHRRGRSLLSQTVAQYCSVAAVVRQFAFQGFHLNPIHSLALFVYTPTHPHTVEWQPVNQFDNTPLYITILTSAISAQYLQSTHTRYSS